MVEKCDLEIREMYFSYYEYLPQSLTDTRNIFSLSVNDFLNQKFIESTINNTPPGQELAFHSRVDLSSGAQMHMPMIDMSTGSAAQLAKLRPFLGEDIFQKFTWYKSGRSYHGYGSMLVTRDEWIVQMGKLLLANHSGMPPTVDPRWVGHRLIGGYSALRWTKNTAHYIDIPKKIY